MTSSVVTTWVGVMRTASHPPGIRTEALAGAGKMGENGYLSSDTARGERIARREGKEGRQSRQKSTGAPWHSK
jgi:hypothetical protein